MPVANIIGFKAQLSPKNQVVNKKTSLLDFYTLIFRRNVRSIVF